MKRSFFKGRGVKVAGVVLLLLVAVVVAVPVVHAQGINGDSVPSTPRSADGNSSVLDGISIKTAFFAAAQWIISWAGFIIAAIFTFFAAIVISIEGWGMEILLALNMNIVNSPVVHFGFSVVLSIANLGFVFAIIVMAIMTIVRNASYGVKQILFKVVLAAIAVNFSLVIAGTILNFSDQFSLYLVRQSVPGNSGGTDSMAFGKFVQNIANTLAPQAGLLPNSDLSTVADRASDSTALTASMLPTILLSAFFLATIVLVLGAIIAMLALRYVGMAFLLVIMPITWLLWVFPGTKKHFSDWWHRFIKWAFFAPIMLFFFYLGMQMSSVIGTAAKLGTDNGFGPSDGATKALGLGGGAEGISKIASEFMNQQLPKYIVMMVIVGGLFAAQKLGAEGAGAAMKMVGSIGNSAKSFAKNQTVGRAQRAGRNVGDRLRTAGQETKEGKTTTLLQRVGERVSNRFGSAPVIGKAARNLGSSISGQTKVDTKRIEEGAKAIEARRAGDTADQTKKHLMELTGKSHNDEVLAAINRAVATPFLLAGIRGEIEKIREKGDGATDEEKVKMKTMEDQMGFVMGRAQRMGKDKELSEADPFLAALQNKPVFSYDPATKKDVTPKDTPIVLNDEFQKGRRIGGAAQKTEVDKMAPALFAQFKEDTGEWVTSNTQLVTALNSVNAGKLKQMSDGNTASMEAYVAALTHLRTEVEKQSKQSMETMTVDQIYRAATAANIHIVRGEAVTAKRMMTLINDGKQIIGHKVPGLAPTITLTQNDTGGPGKVEEARHPGTFF